MKFKIYFSVYEFGLPNLAISISYFPIYGVNLCLMMRKNGERVIYKILTSIQVRLLTLFT